MTKRVCSSCSSLRQPKAAIHPSLNLVPHGSQPQGSKSCKGTTKPFPQGSKLLSKECSQLLHEDHRFLCLWRPFIPLSPRRPEQPATVVPQTRLNKPSPHIRHRMQSQQASPRQPSKRVCVVQVRPFARECKSSMH